MKGLVVVCPPVAPCSTTGACPKAAEVLTVTATGMGDGGRIAFDGAGAGRPPQMFKAQFVDWMSSP